MKDGPLLFYCKDGILYPVGLTKKEQELFELAVRVVAPLKVDFERPLGKVVKWEGYVEGDTP